MLATSVVGDAEVALARAHAAEGEKYAPYETTLADLYLVKAKEEQGYAHYSDARDLAGEAVQFAEAATRKAAERRTSADAPPTANVQHPDAPAAVAPAPAATSPAAPPTVQQPSQNPPPAGPTPAPPPERKPKSPIDPGNPP